MQRLGIIVFNPYLGIRRFSQALHLEVQKLSDLLHSMTFAIRDMVIFSLTAREVSAVRTLSLYLLHLALHLRCSAWFVSSTEQKLVPQVAENKLSANIHAHCSIWRVIIS